MRKQKSNLDVILSMVLASGVIPLVSVLAETPFTDINSPQYYGKTGIPKAYQAIDANFEMLATTPTNDNLVILGDLDVGSNVTVGINGNIGNDLTVSNNVHVGVSVTTTTMRVNGIFSLEGGGFLVETQDGYIKIGDAHFVSHGDGVANLGSSTQQFGYAYIKETVYCEDLVARNSGDFGTNVTIGGNLIVSGVTTSDVLVIVTSSIFPTGDILILEIESGVVTNTTVETGAVTAAGVNTVATPAGTITPQVDTPIGTMTPETVTVTAAGVNTVATPAGTITPQVDTPIGTITPQAIIITNYVTPVFEYAVLTNENFTVTNVFSTVTNITWTEVVYNVMTNGTVAITPDFMTNATVAITPDFATNEVVIVTVTGGAGIWTNATVAIAPDFMTNATVAITPDFATNEVVGVTVTGGAAVVTNVLDETN